MKIRVTFESNDIEGNEIGEIHDKELSENFLKILTGFFGDNSLIYGKEIGAWETADTPPQPRDIASLAAQYLRIFSFIIGARASYLVFI
jgi:hypothetical protein